MSDQSRSSFSLVLQLCTKVDNRLLCLVLSLVNIATVNGQETGDCNFDTIKTTGGPWSGDTCGWRNFFTGTGLLQWKTLNKQTITAGTGPPADHTTGKSYYIFCEGKNWRSLTDKNVVGYLRSPLLPSHTTAKCMHFWYHMYGSSTKNLTIFFNSTSVQWKQMFSENDQLNAWRSGRLTTPAESGRGPYQIIIMAATYSDVIAASDIAIDDISFSYGPCRDCVGKRWHNGVTCVPCGYCVDDQKCAGDGLCSSCKHGYKQAKCIDCADNSYNDGSGCKPCGQCDRGRTCNDRSGLCDACRIGWKMPLCQKCVVGFYSDSGGCHRCGHCNMEQDCARNDGACPRMDGQQYCANGYYGFHCDKQCPAGQYGPNCQKLCGECSGGKAKCPHDDGRCDEGCLVGYDPPLCNRCPENTWGQDCTETCGECSQGVECDFKDGKCVACEPGKKLPYCKDECEAGFFGDNCESVCGSCPDGFRCDAVNGTCTKGCYPGYKPPFCLVACDDGYYGDCSSKCGWCDGGALCDKKNRYCKACVAGFEMPFCEVCKLETGCKEAESTGTSTKAVSDTPFFIGMFFLAVVLACGVVIVATRTYRRRRNRLARRGSHQNVQIRLNVPDRKRRMQQLTMAENGTGRPVIQLPSDYGQSVSSYSTGGSRKQSDMDSGESTVDSDDMGSQATSAYSGSASDEQSQPSSC